MARSSDADDSLSSIWRAAAWPALSLLGLVLPLVFLPQIEDYLYYVRVGELIPIYGTAWLFLLALAIPLTALLALLLKLLARSRGLDPVREATARALIGIAGAGAIGALLYSVLMWMQSFGALTRWSFTRESLWPSLAAGALIAWITRPAGAPAWLVSARRLATLGTIAGACAALSVPLAAWSPSTGAPAHGSSTAAARTRPDIVLLTIDALSAEHMSLYGSTRPTTPMLSAFAQHATTFDRAYANANFTTPGIASILTGTRPWTHRALQLPSWPDADARRVSLPALLQQAGYETAYVSTNPAAGADKNGLGRFFDFASRDRIRDPSLCTDTLSSLFKYACPIASMPLFSRLSSWNEEARGGRDAAHYDPELAIAPALSWLQHVDRRRPVFLWVHLFPPHSPYAAPPPWLGEFDASAEARRIRDSEPHWGYELSRVPDARVQVLAARYDESVAYSDHYAGLFLQRALQILGDDTVVVVTADHGESFRHGYGAHTGPGLFDEIIHIPLIVKLPRQTLAKRSAVLAEQVDIAPTLAQLAGIRAPRLWEGSSLLAASRPAASDATAAAADEPAFSMNFEQNRRFAPLSKGAVAVVDGRWKLVHDLGRLRYPEMPPPQDKLFDLLADPAESVNLAAEQPSIVVRLRGLIAAQLARHGGAVGVGGLASGGRPTKAPDRRNGAPRKAQDLGIADQGF